MSASGKSAKEKGIAFYFPHELSKAEVEFLVADAGPPPAPKTEDKDKPAAPAPPPAPASGPTAKCFKDGAKDGAPWDTKSLTVDRQTAHLSLDFVGAGFKDGSLTFESSPFFFKGPPPPPAPPKPPPRPHKNLSVKGKLGINFGKDILKITGALNAGGGAGVTGSRARRA